MVPQFLKIFWKLDGVLCQKQHLRLERALLSHLCYRIVLIPILLRRKTPHGEVGRAWSLQVRAAKCRRARTVCVGLISHFWEEISGGKQRGCETCSGQENVNEPPGSKGDVDICFPENCEM